MTQTIVLCTLILYLGVMNYLEKQKATDREKDLLNRLAARDLQDYAMATKRLDRGEKPVVHSINELLKEGEDILPVN